MKATKSKLDAFADQLWQWSEVEHKPLREIVELLAAAGCKSSSSRVGSFLEAQRTAEMRRGLLAQIASGNETCKAVERQFASSDAPGVQTILKLFRVLIMQLSVNGAAQPELLKLAGDLMKPVLGEMAESRKAKELELAQDKFELLKAKAEQADKAKEVTSSQTMTPAEKEAEMRRIFGMQ